MMNKDIVSVMGAVTGALFGVNVTVELFVWVGNSHSSQILYEIALCEYNPACSLGWSHKR